MVTPRGHASLSLRVFSEDEAQQNVEAANRKQEKGRDERKVVDVVREDRRADSTWHDLISGRMAETDRGVGTYRHCMTPSGPRPKSEPSTGKNRSKNARGHPISERMSATIWKTIKSRLRTAQNSPAGWFGTVLLLRKDGEN
jgi:hypothetical protein